MLPIHYYCYCTFRWCVNSGGLLNFEKLLLYSIFVFIRFGTYRYQAPCILCRYISDRMKRRKQKWRKSKTCELESLKGKKIFRQINSWSRVHEIKPAFHFSGLVIRDRMHTLYGDGRTQTHRNTSSYVYSFYLQLSILSFSLILFCFVLSREDIHRMNFMALGGTITDSRSFCLFLSKTFRAPLFHPFFWLFISFSVFQSPWLVPFYY